MLVRLLMTLVTCLALSSNSPAIALTRAPFVMGFALEFAFMGFAVLGGNISRCRLSGRKERAWRLRNS